MQSGERRYSDQAVGSWLYKVLKESHVFIASIKQSAQRLHISPVDFNLRSTLANETINSQLNVVFFSTVYLWQ